MITTHPSSTTPAAAPAASSAARPPIAPRSGPREFADVPKHWFAGLAVPTQISNGVNLLFPAGERFFVRSVYHYLERIEDPALRAAIKGFGGQEGRHARSHEDFFATMRAQGYEIDRFLKVYEWLSYTLLERVAPPALRLAATAAAEHYTAIMAAGAAADMPLEHAHPAMRQLLYWHAAEELEHKSVAFDVLQQVNSSYALRIAGLAMSTAMLASMWLTATAYLLWQDGVSPRAARRELRSIHEARPTEPIFRRVFLRGIRAYLRRDFHPDHDDNYHLAGQLLAKADAAGAELATARGLA
jgi:predicted metal-dependent hydrolase